MNISILKNIVQEYAWGSRTSIPELLGNPSPSEKPQAEMWMGAHPKASSQIAVNGDWTPLTEIIRKYPEKILGAEVAEKFSNSLPFLFKVLAADRPLSVQAHPNLSQAQKGFERENTQGIPIDDFHRNYRDNNHKPELICALTPFTALNGFRPIPEILELANTLCSATLEPELEALHNSPDSIGLKYFFQDIMTMPEHRQKEVIACAADTASGLAGVEPAWEWIIKLHEEYPEDIGVISPLFLNLVELKPGQAMYLPAGELHSYLKGTGAELMANSDNVIRGGLTPKHIDVEELMNILTFKDRKPEILEPNPTNHYESAYPTNASEFVLSVIHLDNRAFESSIKRNVEILLCTAGEAEITEEDNKTSLKKGDSVIVPASVKAYSIKGDATIYKASVLN